jgi:hypothetical protein
MARVILTSPGGDPAPPGSPPSSCRKGACLEVTAAMAAVIAGRWRHHQNIGAMSATAAHDQLGEAVGVSNSSA